MRCFKAVLLVWLFALLPLSNALAAATHTWTKMVTFDDHILALDSDGTLWGWGDNRQSQLGQGSAPAVLVRTTAPVQIGTDNTWVEIGASRTASFGIKANGTLWGWGDNNGRCVLANGSESGYEYTPRQIMPGTAFSSLSISYNSGTATATDGTVWVWGDNGSGALSRSEFDLGNVCLSSPVSVTFGPTYVQFSHAVRDAIFMIDTQGRLWGRSNSASTLGDPTWSIDTTVDVLVDSNTDWLNATFYNNEYTVVVRKANGEIWTWGNNDNGSCGRGDSGGTPLGVGKVSGLYTAASSGRGTTLAVGTDGKTYAWGKNRNGAAGLDPEVYGDAIYTPTEIFDKPATNLLSGDETGFVGFDDGTIISFGINDEGQMADPSLQHWTTPRLFAYGSFGGSGGGGSEGGGTPSGRAAGPSAWGGSGAETGRIYLKLQML